MKERLRRQVKEMMEIVSNIDKLSELPLNHENRGKVRKAVKAATNYGFTRQDDREKGKIVLYLGQGPLSEMVQIGSCEDKIFVCTDGLWGTICGLNEQIQEMECYEREAKNW